MPSHASTSDSEEHWMYIIRHMMYVYGDSHMPLIDCQMLLVDLVHQEMMKLIDEAQNVINCRNANIKNRGGQQQIEVTHLVWQFRRHPELLLRLVNFAKARELSSTVEKTTNNEADVTDGKDINPEMLALGQPTAPKRARTISKPKKLLCQVREAVEVIDSLGTLQLMFNPSGSQFDEGKFTRETIIAERNAAMSTEEYEEFCECRRFSFCTQPQKRKADLMRKFREWLGSPKISDEALWILSFCATEIVAQTVRIATTSRLHEAKNYFKDEVPAYSLQVRHYEEALRRTPRRRLFKGCLLFADF